MKQILFVALVYLSSCSNPLSNGKSFVQDNFGPGTQNKVSPAVTGYEMVSGSKVGLSTNGGAHKVDITVGAATSQIRITTTRNKILYMSVQGQLSSNQ